MSFISELARRGSWWGSVVSPWRCPCVQLSASRHLSTPQAGPVSRSPPVPPVPTGPLRSHLCPPGPSALVLPGVPQFRMQFP